MIRKITALILFLSMIGYSLYIKSQIDVFNLDYYHGKDNGFFVQLNSVLFFGIVFFLVLSRKSRILMGFLGLVTGLVLGIVCYLIFLTAIWFPISASVLIMLVFFVIDYFMQRKKKQNTNNLM